MKAAVEWLADGWLKVTVDGREHTVAAAHFGFDGSGPMLDFGGYALKGKAPEPGSVRQGSMDSAPEDDQ